MTSSVTERRLDAAGNPLPDLDADLLRSLVIWAYADHEDDEAWKAMFPDWGSWEQTVWGRSAREGVCGSSYCIAGQAVAQKGYALLFGDEGQPFTSDIAFSCAPVISTDNNGRPTEIDRDNKVPISTKGAEAIGLTVGESEYLFESANTIGDIVNMALMIAERRGVALDLPDVVEAQDSGFWSSVGDMLEAVEDYENPEPDEDEPVDPF